MSRITALPGFLWELVVGDDWVTAVGITAALGLTALAPDGAPSWLLAPLAAIGLLWASVRRASPSRSETSGD